MKDEAERLRIGIRGGWLRIEDAVTWADRQIAQAKEPHVALLEIASSNGRSREAIVALLAHIPGTAESIAVMRWCLSDLLETVEREPGLAFDAARWLENAANAGDLPDAEFGWEATALADEFSLALQGCKGSPEEARERLLSFLREHSRRRA